MIIFNPETGLEAEETSVVRENIRQEWGERLCYRSELTAP